MAVTRLKRKERKNRARATNRQAKIKNLTAKPVIKNIDIEAVKQEFAAKTEKGSKTKASKKAEATSEESKNEETTSEE
jgi:hypothetical protein